MRIVFVHQGSELYGSDRCLIETVAALRGGFPDAETEVVLPRRGTLAGALEAAGVTVAVRSLWILRRRHLAYLLTLGLVWLVPALVRAARRFRGADLVYVNTSVVFDHLLVSRFFPGRCIAHIHEAPSGPTGRVLRMLLGWSRARLVFNSEATRDAFRPLRPDQGNHVVHNGFAPPSDAPSAAALETRRDVRLLMIGRISPNKGQDVLVRALSLLEPALRDRLQVRIVGSAFEDEEAERALAGEIRQRALAARVSLHPFTADPAEHYRWADLVVVPTRFHESLGRVAIEAMAYGRPALVSALGGLKEVVEPGRTGWWVPPDDADALAATLGEIVQHPAAWSGFGEDARLRFRRLFSADVIAGRLVGIVGAHLAEAAASNAETSSRRVAAPGHLLGGVLALVRRFALGLAGEGVQSGFHFVLNIVLMRNLPAYDYGLFAIVFTLGSLAVSYSNALVATPAAVYMPRFNSPGAVAFQDVVLGSVATALSVASGLLAALGLLAWGLPVASVIMAGLFVALWALRNYVRVALYARRRPAGVVRSDVSFAVTGTLAIAAVLASRPDEGNLLALSLAVLTLANAVGIGVGLLGQHTRPTVSFRPAIWRRYGVHWSQISWSLVGVTTANVQAQFQAFLVALLAGPAAYAPIAAALVLVAPLRLAMAALIYMLQPEFAAEHAAGRDDRVRRLLLSSAGLVLLACLVYGLVLWLGFDLLRSHVFGPSFLGEPMLLITMLAWATALAYLSYTLPKAVMEAAGDFRAVAGATLASAIVGVVCVSALLWLSTPAWSLAGVIAAELVTLVHFWIRAERIARKPPVSVPAPA